MFLRSDFGMLNPPGFCNSSYIYKNKNCFFIEEYIAPGEDWKTYRSKCPVNIRKKEFDWSNKPINLYLLFIRDFGLSVLQSSLSTI